MNSIPVYLPKEVQETIYQEILVIARKAVAKAEDEVKNVVNNRYMNKRQLCKYFNCHPKIIEEWQREGLKSFKKGRETLFDLEDVHSFLDKKKY